MRINQHPILESHTEHEIEFTFSGKTYKALKGDSIAAALLANGIRAIRYTEKTGEPRGLYCGIGHCYECRVHLEGAGEVRACITPVKEGMVLSRKKGDNQSL